MVALERNSCCNDWSPVTCTCHTWSIILSNCGVLSTIHYDRSHIVPLIHVFMCEVAGAGGSRIQVSKSRMLASYYWKGNLAIFAFFWGVIDYCLPQYNRVRVSLPQTHGARSFGAVAPANWQLRGLIYSDTATS